MSDPYIGEIRMFGGNYAPNGWLLCAGQVLSISENDVLFSLLGTTYGGDGQTTFALPDLRGRAPIHHSGEYAQGQQAFLAPGSGEPAQTAPPFLCVNFIIAIQGIYPAQS